MNLPRSIRVLIAMAVLVLGLAALLLLLTISEATLNIQAHLDEAPAWLRFGWWAIIGAVSLLTGWILWRILRPDTQSRSGSDNVAEPVSAAQIEEKIARAEELGADTSEIRRELSELERRREAGEVHVAMFGEISTGKSALVHALLPQVQTSSDVRGGTTREIRTFAWQSPGGDTLLISDTPGTAEVDGSLDQQATDEAKRAHIVIYVTDGDYYAVEVMRALGREDGGLVRIGFLHYTTEDEVDRLLAALHELAANA